MADFAPANAGHAAHFADGKRREVVVQHEPLLGLAFEPLDALRVIGRAQRGGNQRLGFAAGEDRGTVNPRQRANFNRDGTNLVELTRIRTATLVGYLVAEDALAKRFIIMRELPRGFFVVFGQLGLQSILDLLTLL